MWYAASLQNCAFGATLSETLRDRVFFGMRDEGVQKRLLTKADLTFAKVLETAEIAERETKDAQNSCRVSQNRNKTEVHQVAAPPRRGRPSGLGACNRCGGAHDTQQCKFRNKVCRKWGQIERACCVKKRAEGTGVGKGVPTRDHSVKELKGDDESNEEWDRLKWGSLHGLAKDKRYGMKQRTMGKPICMWSSS